MTRATLSITLILTVGCFTDIDAAHSGTNDSTSGDDSTSETMSNPHESEDSTSLVMSDSGDESTGEPTADYVKPWAACGTDTACQPFTECYTGFDAIWLGYCAPTCAEAADCLWPFGYEPTCDTTAHVCALACDVTADCPGGFYCVDVGVARRCLPPAP